MTIHSKASIVRLLIAAGDKMQKVRAAAENERMASQFAEPDQISSGAPALQSEPLTQKQI